MLTLKALEIYHRI